MNSSKTLDRRRPSFPASPPPPPPSPPPPTTTTTATTMTLRPQISRQSSFH